MTRLDRKIGRREMPRRYQVARLACGALAVLAACSRATPNDWPTHRGNPERTGSLDDRRGPAKPKVFWAYRAQEHFIASPVVGGKVLYVSGLGPFNTPVLHGLSLGPDEPGKALWTKTAPYVKRPMVCSPALVDGLAVFGDGMHQTDSAILYCIRADTGRAVWQYAVPGHLVHMEGSPTIANGRVFIGGGDAGVLCVALKQVRLDGRDLSFAALGALLEKRWGELAARYEQQRKKDPDFALPPSDDALPKASPVLLWQKGKGTWHVDAPVAVRGDRVVVASAFLDAEKVGRRSLLCLRAGDGAVLWETPLTINPWTGATLAGDLALVGCSSIRYDPKLIPRAKGEVLAVELASGKVRWRKPVPGGVLSPLAVKGDSAFFTATDGKIRCWQVATGKEKWVREASAGFFAGCALAGGMVYAADLKSVVHALAQADGKPQWTLDLSSHPAVQAPGQVYGSPVVHGGDIYLATCNLEGPSADQPCAVVCLSDRAPAEGPGPGEAITIDRVHRTVTVPCRIAPRKLATLKEVYPLEVVATYPAPRGQKAHETVVVFDVKPSDVHKALVALGLKPGRPALGEGPPAQGREVGVSLVVPGLTGRPRVIPIEKAMVDRRTGKPLPPLKWIFTGSALRQVDPDKDDKVYGADLSGTLISLFPVTNETVFQANLTMREGNLLRLETNKNVLPPEGTSAKLILRVKPKPWWQPGSAGAKPGRKGNGSR